MNPQSDYDETPDNYDDRTHLIRTANKLATAFNVWAVVVGIVGVVAAGLLAWILNGHMTLQSNMILIKERQDTVLRRLERLEDRKP